jgi:hypothetical protein
MDDGARIGTVEHIEKGVKRLCGADGRRKA